MIDEDTPLFPMPGAREVAELSGGDYITKLVSTLERSVYSNPNLSFDLAKSLIESVCKTILNDRGHEFDRNINFPTLTRTTLEQLQIVPDEYAEAAAVKQCFDKTLDGFLKIFSGIGELRNKEGLASHGKDAYTPMLDPLQAQLMARAADAVVNFLYKSHRNYVGPQPYRGISYEENEEYNQYIDSIHSEIVIFEEYTFKPSEVLYQFDQVAYNDQRIEFTTSKQPEDRLPGVEDPHEE